MYDKPGPGSNDGATAQKAGTPDRDNGEESPRNMLREDLNDALRKAVRARDRETAATLRLILAALKDRDIAAHGGGGSEGIGEDDIRRMLEKMARQARESAQIYDNAGRPELAESERQAEAVVRRFLPQPLDDSEAKAAIDQALAETGAKSLKDMGRVMALLHERYTGRMDFAEASARIKARLG